MAITKGNDGTAGESASKILEAVKEGDVDGVREFLKAGGDVNLSTPSTGRTLLHVSSRQVMPMYVPDPAYYKLARPHCCRSYACILCR